MVQLSISFKTSSKMTSVKHNNRDLTEEEFLEPAHRHIDQTKLQDNIYIKQENLKECYRDLFRASLEKYNAAQKRQDRVIKDYYQHVKKSKTLDLQREFIVGIGSKHDWERINPEGKKIVGRLLADYVEGFQKRHPHLYVFNAAVHLDEKGHPHAHFNIIPLGTGYKKGLAIQPSFKKALQNEGYYQKGRGQLKAFRDGEIKILEGMLRTIGVERKLVGTNDIKDMHEYKQMVAEVEREKERLLADIAVERSKMLSEQFDLESGINTLAEQKKALEAKIEALDNEIFYKEEHRDSLEMEVLSFEETTLPRLRRESQELLRSRENLLDGFERKVGEIVQEAKKDLPEAPEAVLDVALVKELGYDDVEDVLLQNLELKRQVTAYRGFWGQLKDTLKDLGMFNALEKAKFILGLMTNFREPVWTKSDAEKLGQIKNRLNPNHKGFERKLQDAIESARREQELRSEDILGRRQPRKDWDGPSL